MIVIDGGSVKRTGADRQRDFAERQKAAGYKRTTVWIHADTEQEGKQAARDGKPLKPMESKDPLSWAAGWISEKSKRSAETLAD